MEFYEIVFYTGIAMMAGSALVGLLACILLRRKGGKLWRLLDSEYGLQSEQQKTPQGAEEGIHRVGTK